MELVIEKLCKDNKHIDCLCKTMLDEAGSNQASIGLVVVHDLLFI